MWKLALLCALLFACAMAGSSNNLEQILTPSLEDTKDTTDKEIVDAVSKGKKEVAKKADKKSGKPSVEEFVSLAGGVDDDDEDDVVVSKKADKKKKKSGEKKRKLKLDEVDYMMEEFGGDEKSKKKKQPKKEKKAPKKKKSLLREFFDLDGKKSKSKSKSDEAADKKESKKKGGKKSSTKLSKDQIALLEHFGYNWKAMQRDGVSQKKVLKLLKHEVMEERALEEAEKRAQQDRTVLTKQEEALLNHFGFDVAKVEAAHIPASMVDAKLQSLIELENQHAQQLEQQQPVPQQYPENVKKVLRDMGYHVRSVAAAGVPAGEVAAVLEQQLQTAEKNIEKNVVKQVQAVDAFSQQEYRDHLAAIKAQVDGVKQVEDRVVAAANEAEAEGESYMQRVALHVKHQQENTMAQVEAMKHQIDVAAVEAKQKIDTEAAQHMEELSKAAYEGLQQARNEVKSDQQQAAAMAEAAHKWYQQVELPFMQHMAQQEQQLDLQRRQAVEAQAEKSIEAVRAEEQKLAMPPQYPN